MDNAQLCNNKTFPGTGALPGLRVLSRNSPSTPAPHEPALPTPYTGFGHAVPAYHLRRAAAFGCGQDKSRQPQLPAAITLRRKIMATVN